MLSAAKHLLSLGESKQKQILVALCSNSTRKPFRFSISSGPSSYCPLWAAERL